MTTDLSADVSADVSPGSDPGAGLGADLVRQQVREVLDEHAHLGVGIEALGDGDDLYRAGLTSHASVTVMLALEDAFDVEFTPDLLTKATFGSVAAITTALGALGASRLADR